VRDSFLPFSRPTLGQAETAELADSLDSGWITTGPKVERFTREFARYVGGAHACALSSATAGLHLSLLAHGIGPGDEVITTPMTFVATLNVIVWTGATPVLVDIDRDTLQIRADAVERSITSRTRAIMPVHFVGQPVDLDPLLELADRHSVPVVEDAAHALGTAYKGRRIGSFPTTSVFSFHPNKNITTGEGGMVVSNDPDIIARVTLLKFHGIKRDTPQQPGKPHSPRYDVTMPGLKYNMMDMQAALGLHQLPKLDEFIERRKRLAGRYHDALADVDGLLLPKSVPYPARHAWHLYTPLVDLEALTIDRDRFIQELNTRNIGTGLHYTAAHEFSFYRTRFGWRPDDYPEAHFVSERILSLPLFPAMSDADHDDVLDAVRDVCVRFAR
jgi:dTDP-4-amino-4,6-dideoxygalactose transaminase